MQAGTRGWWVILRPLLLLIGILAGTVAHATAEDFPEARNTQEETAPLLTAEQALAKLRLPAGFRATLFAGEPAIRQPIAITFDARGRLFVAENYTYAERPLGYDPSHRDRIVVLEDVDHDGRHDRRTVFHDQCHQLTSVEVGFGGVWAMCPPQLLFIPDADADLVPDADPIVVLDGFDIGPANTHNFANGLKWGPDGWLYGRAGITAPGKIGIPGTPIEQRVDIGPSIWRYHPVTRQVEEVCTGTTNPWGHDWDQHGELFFINTVIGHLWYVPPGAHFRRMFGADRNPYVYQLIEQTADHFHWDTAEVWHQAKKGLSSGTDQAGGGHAHSGMMIYQAEQWPAEYRNKLFTLNLHGRRVNVDRLERAGASFVGKHEADMLFSDDVWFRGIELAQGPDGAVYIADWSDVGECHENDGVHRTSGRIYKILHEGSPLPKPIDLPALSSKELVPHLVSPNVWLARQAQKLLQERAAAGEDLAPIRPGLLKLSQSTAAVHRLRGLWTEHVTGLLDATGARRNLTADDEHLRTWSIRLMLADPTQRTTAVPELVNLARQDSSGLVLLACASALQQLPIEARAPLAAALLKRGTFTDDPVYPLMVWYGIEPLVIRDPQTALQLASASELPLVSRFILRRLAQGWDQLSLDATRALLTALPQGAEARRLTWLQGLNEGLRGWRKLPAPGGWTATQQALEAATDPQIRQLTREIAVVFGDGRALEQLRELALSGETDIATRRSALASLIEARPDDLGKVLRGLLNDRDLSPEAIRGLAVANDDESATLLVNGFGGFFPAGKEAAVQTLAARPRDAGQLIAAIEAGTVPRQFVPIEIVRQMQGYDDLSLRDGIQRVWPELRPITADKKARISQFKERLNPETRAAADLTAGRKLWDKSCGKCHVLFGEGGKIGPDLTGAQRHNLDYLLENVVDPSATLLPQFRLTTMNLVDGRVVNGVVLTKTEQTWEVQTPTEKLTLRVADIEEHALTTQSLMPEGLLDLLTPEEVRDLVGYVMSPRQVPRE